MFKSSLCACLALSLVLGACGQQDTGVRVLEEEASYGTVKLQLSAEHAELAARLELTFLNEAGERIEDAFETAGDPSLLTRNYRIPPGDYAIEAAGIDADGNTVLEGNVPHTTVEPGNNTIELLLTPTAEDLGDVYVELDSPNVTVGFVAADGDAREGGFARVQVQVDVAEGVDPEIKIGGSVMAEGPAGEFEVARLEFVPNPEDGHKFAAETEAIWLGPARLDIKVFEDGALADSTTKMINVHPSAETMELIRALESALAPNADGGFELLEQPIVTENGFALAGEGLVSLNEAIIHMNTEALEAGMTLGANQMVNAMIYAALGYWACVAKVLKCELLSLGCAAAVPAAVVACGEICVGTIGLGCVACVVAAIGGTVDICDSALDCWKEAKKEGCIP